MMCDHSHPRKSVQAASQQRAAYLLTSAALTPDECL